MKDREIACIHYAAEGQCKLGKRGTFNRACQHCKSYRPLKGGKPRRTDLRKQKKEKFEKNFKNWE